MPKIVLKNRANEPVDLDGAHVVVLGSNGQELGLNQELANLRARISGLIAASDAMVFKGIVSTQAPLPTSDYQVGWTYKVGAAGTYAGQKCEPGDMLICVSGCEEDPADSDWDVIQANIDGAVTGPAKAISGNLTAFANASGKTIRDAGISMADAGEAVAKRHSHANADVINGLGRDDKNNLTYNGSALGDDRIDCIVINAGEAIPENLRENGLVIEIQAAG